MDNLDEIKSKIDIVEFVSGYFPLKKAGRNFKALCPFHSEKTPSFIVSPERQIWHCFGCGAGGDIFGFLMKIENLDFSEALQALAQRAGVTLVRYKPELKEKKTNLFEINRLATLFYHKILKEKPEAQKALDYLIKKRDLPEKIIDEFQLGYAPNKKDVLYQFLIERGFSRGEIFEAGLARDISGRTLDFFKNRIIFPFTDSIGRITGFTGRALDPKDEPKYLNIAQNLVFDKSRTLYRIDLAKNSIKEKDYTVLVEGQMDVLASAKVGIENVVCSSGTALTTSQIELLKKYANNLVLAFDMDLAGDSATKRGIEEALEKGLSIKVAVLPFGKDPDECIKKDPKLWVKALKEAPYFVDFYFSSVFDKIKPRSLEEKKKAAYEILPILAKIPDKIEQAYFISNLSSRLQIPDKFINDALSSFKKEGKEFISKEVHFQDQSQIIEERLLGLLLTFPDSLKHFITKLEFSDFSSPEFSKIYKKVQELYTEEEFDLSKLKKSLDQDLSMKVDLITLGVKELYGGEDQREIFEEIESYIKRIVNLKLDKQKRELEFRIKEAEKLNDKKKIQELVSKFQRIISEENKEK